MATSRIFKSGNSQAYGADKSQRSKEVLSILQDFSKLIPVLPITADCGKLYGRVKADLEKTGQTIGNNDLWIAAHAPALGLTLLTNNSKEFERIPHLNIEKWV